MHNPYWQQQQRFQHFVNGDANNISPLAVNLSYDAAYIHQKYFTGKSCATTVLELTHSLDNRSFQSDTFMCIKLKSIQ
jgi:hypothetical protein